MSGSSPLTLDQIDALILALDKPRDQAALLLACGCGLRAGTLCGLRICHVLDKNHTLTGQLEIPRRIMKGKRQAHRVDIPARALKALGIWLAQHPAPHRQAPLWPSETNQEENISTRQWQRIIAKGRRTAAIGGRITPHSARKFYAHAIYQATDRDIGLTTRALGNVNPMSTMHYLDYGQRKISAATMEVFNAATTPELPLGAPEKTTSTTN